MTKSIDIEGHPVTVFDPDEAGGLEKLKTMDVNDIEEMIERSMTELICGGEPLMANCLPKLLEPIRRNANAQSMCGCRVRSSGRQGANVPVSSVGSP